MSDFITKLRGKIVAEFSDFFSLFRYICAACVFSKRRKSERNLCSWVVKMISFCLCNKRNQFEQMISFERAHLNYDSNLNFRFNAV